MNTINGILNLIFYNLPINDLINSLSKLAMKSETRNVSPRLYFISVPSHLVIMPSKDSIIAWPAAMSHSEVRPNLG